MKAPTLKSLPALACALLAAGTANASMLTVDVTWPSGTFIPPTPAVVSNAFTPFDTTLGNLTEISVMFDITVNANSMTTEIDLLDPNAVTLGSSTGSSPFNLTGSVNITDPMSFAQYEVPASFTRFAVFVQGEPDIGQRINSVSSTSFTVTYDYTPAATPLPAALPLFATGLGALGLLGWRRKRSAQA